MVYDQGPSFAAARAWWVLRYVGLEDVRVLDGGLAAWKRAGLPTSTAVPDPAPGSYSVSSGHLPVLDAQQAARVAREGSLLDARALERFTGSREPVDPVAGHIPGALSAPTTDNVTGDGTFRTGPDLRRRFLDLGVAATGPVGVYCGSGVTAAHELLALQEAGIEAALYVGSWSDWVSDPSRPVATGP
ncbi:sulfurtransferase [Pedococcus sp. 5OH_020]|uniref:sulfurtransferase n=1 Tax=Pedococcus sp. 5OH_020 TaxID=2989814 RepID=UPI002FDBA341